MRSIDPIRDSPHLTSYKGRQVFSILMAMQRQANPKDLKYWAMIETTAYYAYGVRAFVVHGSNFAGRTNSTTFRDRCYADFTATKKRAHMTFLFNQWVASFT